ncbi:MAG TPA: NAD(P)-binding domain-containing protein, partial [Nocardioides sp.]
MTTAIPESLQGKTVAVLGGTGPQGRGLARRFAAAGLNVVLGSRTEEKGKAAAAELAEALSGTEGVGVIAGSDNAGASAAGDVVLVVVPWDGHKELLESLRTELAGKVVVDCVNPLGFDKQGPYALKVEEGSATEQAQA